MLATLSSNINVIVNSSGQVSEASLPRKPTLRWSVLFTGTGSAPGRDGSPCRIFFTGRRSARVEEAQDTRVNLKFVNSILRPRNTPLARCSSNCAATRQNERHQQQLRE